MALSKLPVSRAWSEALVAWASSMRTQGLRDTTIATRTDWIRRLARHCLVDPHLVTDEHVEDYLAAHSWALETRRSVYNSLRLFFRFMVVDGRISDDPARDLPRVKTDHPRARPATSAALRDALDGADARTRLILSLAAYAGLRRGEIAQVHARDIIDDLIGYSLIVHGKGGKQRIVPLDDRLADDLRSATVGGYAFPGDLDGHLSPRYVGKLAARALPGTWTLHTLRHRFATMAYAQTHDLLAVQQLLGHSSPAITQRYIQMPDDRLRRVAAAARAA